MSDGSRTFFWHMLLGKPCPQVVAEPRVGCAGMTIVAGTAVMIQPSDTRTLDQLAADYPAPITAEI